MSIQDSLEDAMKHHPTTYNIPYKCTKCDWETVGRQNLCRCGKCMNCHSKVEEKNA